jgi:hypothetical protein
MIVYGICDLCIRILRTLAVTPEIDHHADKVGEIRQFSPGQP